MNAAGIETLDLLAFDEAVAALDRGGCLWVGLSGGRDSIALLHILHERFGGALGGRLRAIHVHHGLQVAADDWASFCERSCERLGVAAQVEPVAVDQASAEGPEGAARNARYAAFERVLTPGDVLALAHHRADQAETLLLRLFRGTGISGLAAMRPWSGRAHFHVWRPLLATSRSVIEAYARQRRLTWIDDPHNEDDRYDRVAVRARLWPTILQRWPQAEGALARSAHLAAETQALLDDLADIDLEGLTVDGRPSVCASLALSEPRRRNALRLWLRRQGVPMPDASVWPVIVRELLLAAEDAAPVVTLGAYELRRYRDAIHLIPGLPMPGAWTCEWDGREALRLPPGCGVLEFNPVPEDCRLTVGFARGGERLRPSGAAHTRSLKNLFQESATPPWERQRTPLLWLDGELVAVADRWISESFRGRLARSGTPLVWRRGDPTQGESPL